MGGFKEMFEAYGTDYHSTMVRFMGNEVMYIKFLDMLPKDDNLEKLGEALEKQDYEEASSAAHTLKGVVGNTGLTPLLHAICAVMEPLRAGTASMDYGAPYQIAQTEFFRVDELRARLKEGW